MARPGLVLLLVSVVSSLAFTATAEDFAPSEFTPADFAPIFDGELTAWPSTIDIHELELDPRSVDLLAPPATNPFLDWGDAAI